MDKRTISLCLTTYNRFQETLEAFMPIRYDDRVSEVIIVDDCSDMEIYKQLEIAVTFCPKVKLFRNQVNYDCYLNKAMAVGLASNEWVIILDSDNILTTDYVDKLFAIDNWDEDTVYQPSWAKPHFDFRLYSGLTIDRHNVASYMYKPMFPTMLNAMNYFVNRNKFLEVRETWGDPHTADSILQNYNHLKNNGKIYVVPELFYHHRVHEGSHYKQNVHLTGDFYQQVENNLRQLR